MQRHLEPEVELDGPAGHGLGQGGTGERAQGRALDKGQRVGGGAAQPGLQIKLGLAGHQVADFGLRLPQLQLRPLAHMGPHLIELQPGAIDLQPRLRHLQARPRRAVGGQHVGGCVVEHHVAQLGRDAKLPAARATVGELPQIAADLQLRLADAPRDNGVAQVAARIGRHVERQVAVDARGVGAQQPALQFEQARKARPRRAEGRVGAAPDQLQLGFEVGVAQPQLGRFNTNSLGADPPLDAGLQQFEWQLRLLKHAGQVELPVFYAQLGLAAAGTKAEVDLGPTHARAPGCVHVPAAGVAVHRRRSPGAQADVAQAPAGAPAGSGRTCARARARARIGRGWGGAPLQGNLLHQAAGRGLAQATVQRLGQGQLQRQLAQHLRIELLALERKPHRGRAVAAGVLVAHIAPWPDQPSGGAKAQPVGAQGGLQARVLQFEPGLQVLQFKGLRHLRPLQLQPLQAQVGAGVVQRTLLPIQPKPGRALPLLHLHPEPAGGVDVTAQLLQIDPRQIGVERAAPVPPRAGPGLPPGPGELGLQAKALAPCRRRGSVEPELVLATAVARYPVDARQHQRLGAGPGVVVPAHGALQNGQLGLVQQPVGQGAVRIGLLQVAQVDAAQQQAAVGAAAQIEHRAFHDELIETQPPERMQRKRRAHTGQAQRLGAAGVAQHHIAQVQTGHRSAGVGLQRADLDLHPQPVAGYALQRRTPFVNSWHNDHMQCGPTEPEQQPRDRQQPQERTQQTGLPVQPAGRCGGIWFFEHTKL